MLVGRDSERQEIARLLAGARAGSSAVRVVVGEAGIGKSALLAEAVGLASGMRVLRATGTSSERDLPFAGLSQLLGPLLGLLDRIPPPQAEALGRALAVRPPGPTDRFAVGAATLGLVCRAAEDGPILVVVDDLHQLDRPSAEALLFAARRLITDPVAVLASWRSEEPGADLLDGLPTLHLGGLAPEVARRLLADRPLTDPQRTRLVELAAGNPLALLEMTAGSDGSTGAAAEASPEAPPTVSALIVEAFGRRTDRLDEAGRGLLLLAAAGGTELSVLARAAGELGLDVDALQPAEQLGLVTLDAGTVRFRHPLLRSAVYQGASAARRRRAHGALAAALRETDPDRWAWHLAEATLTPDPQVARAVHDAATSAAARGAHAVASDGFERAARLSPDPASRALRLAEAGESAWLAGRPDRALALLQQAERDQTDPAAIARIRLLRGTVTARSRSLDDARQILTSAAHDCQDADPDLAVRMLAEAVYTCFYLADAAGARHAGEQIDLLLDGVRTERARRLGAVAREMALILGGRGEPGAVRLRHALLAEGSAELADDPLWWPWLVAGLLWLREAGEVRPRIEQTLDRARSGVSLGVLPFLLFHAARDEAVTNRWASAEAQFLEAIRLAEETGNLIDRAVSAAGLAWLLARQGRVVECRAHAEAAAEACRTHQVHLGSAWLRYALGDLEAACGDPVAAAEQYQQLCDHLDAAGIVDPDLVPAAEQVDLLVRAGRADEARSRAEAYHALASAKGQPWSLARAHRALALAGIEPAVNFATAVELHAATEDAYETARTELAFGAHLRRVRRRVEARTHLAAAVQLFESLAATPWAEAAVQELAATGETVVRRRGDPVQHLTPQEFQVARLLARGRTTREAAAALFLSPKTVEYHLRHVYLKLGIGSRAELSQRLADAPGVSSDRP